MPLMKDRAQRVYKAGRQPSFKGNEIYHLGGWEAGGVGGGQRWRNVDRGEK